MAGIVLLRISLESCNKYSENKPVHQIFSAKNMALFCQPPPECAVGLYLEKMAVNVEIRRIYSLWIMVSSFLLGTPCVEYGFYEKKIGRSYHRGWYACALKYSVICHRVGGLFVTSRL